MKFLPIRREGGKENKMSVTTEGVTNLVYTKKFPENPKFFILRDSPTYQVVNNNSVLESFGSLSKSEIKIKRMTCFFGMCCNSR